MHSYLRGHRIILVAGRWIYADTLEPTEDNWKGYPCGHCGLKMTDEGHDGCLGILPGVMNACCGHGIDDQAYVQLLDGNSIHGSPAIVLLAELKQG